MGINRVINIVAIICLLAINCNAQPQVQNEKRTPEERAQRQTKWMEKNVGISPDQSDKVYHIILDHARAMDNTMNMDRGREKAANRRGIVSDREAQIRKVLTGEQYDRYQQLMQQKKQQMRERRSQNMNEAGY